VSNATLDWAGCATFRLTVDDTVVFLDAYLDRVPDAAQSDLTVDSVDRADFILVGHSHFDHLWGAERIAPRTGATVIGSYETIRLMAAQGVPESQLLAVSGGERVRLSDNVVVSVYPSLHSCVWTGPFQQPDVVCLGDTGLTLDQQKVRFRELEAHIATLSPDARAHALKGRQGERGDGGALLYLIETPEGSLLYQDTSGHWSGIVRDLRPDVAILAAAGRGNVDGDPMQGTLAEFVARQAEFLQPNRVLLSHHDNWLPGFSLETNTAPIRDALAERVPSSELVETGYMAGYPLFA
jgi:L-ascorbate metabolism protein UlaG (beta-lactamase superfamily)